MPRTVTVLVHYEPDRSLRVVVPGPVGPVGVGRTRISAEVGRLARAGVRAVLGPEPVDIDLQVDRPPWLREGMVVQLDPRAVDPDEGISHPYARVAGFLPVGGVMVVHPETGVAICAPEHLTPIQP